MARVLRVTANLKEAISIADVLTNRNLIEGSMRGQPNNGLGTPEIQP
ncbi:MAG: hypothetical protein KBG33_07085 [Paludibacteraceae bacterium]|nr:hypothetical protein [Paludibacteraceae bacterium]MBP8967142.1 hypothetical protein [Paludibacteraceae bacterium]HPL76430.1 hypothetical protein [Paludibacteraceae bacterium]